MRALDRAAGPPKTWGPSLGDRLSAAASRVGLPHLLLLAIVLRLAVLSFATPAHPDEVFQYLEPAHRLVFGYGVITWEWREGMRGWLLPILVSGPMRLGAWLDPHGGLYLAAPKLVMTLASLGTVVVAWRLGAGISRLHAQVAGFIAAIWYEFIYFAPHVLSETAAIALILPAAVLLIEKARWTDRRLASAAALLACAAAIRFQYLAAIATLVIACCALDLRRCWRPLLLGGLAGLLPSVLSDMSMGAVPFAWIVENVRLNLVEHRAASFSASGPFGYVTEVWPRLTLWVVPLVALAGLGARRYPALAWMALANLVFHSAIAHKEYRFIFLSVLATVLLAAIGTADWVAQVARKDGPEAGRRKLRLLCVVWVLASVSCACGAFRTEWTKSRPEMDLYARLRSDASLCGLALYRHDYAATGAYAYLHRPVPMLFITDEVNARPWADLARDLDAFNAILTGAEHTPEVPHSYKPVDCEGAGERRVCVYKRPGACLDSGPHSTINAVLERLGK